MLEAATGALRGSAFQTNCSTRPTAKTHDTPPAINTAAVIASGARNFPVRSTRNTVNAGAKKPERYANLFCYPVDIAKECDHACASVVANYVAVAVPQAIPIE